MLESLDDWRRIVWMAQMFEGVDESTDCLGECQRALVAGWVYVSEAGNLYEILNN